MLNILGENQRFCDGVSRRSFLKLGGLAMGGLSLPQLLEAEAQAGIGSSNKSVIMIFLVGGAPHIDMFDLKPEAPPEIRGEYRAIDTKVPGIQVCEHLPKLAATMDKLVVLRSLVGGTPEHSAHICLTGYRNGKNGPLDWPSFGCLVSKVQGPVELGVSPFVSLTPKMGHSPWGLAGPTGFLGPASAPFQPQRGGEDSSLLDDMSLQGITLERLADRKSLLASFDNFRREVDRSGVMAGIDSFNEQAYDVLTSNRLVAALDIEREDPQVRARYGPNSYENIGVGGAHCVENFLLARRLVEAGVRCVSLAFGHWDWHSKQYTYLKEDFPPFDQGLSALIEDLHERGLDKDVSVVVWGEMGRTPKINKVGGRDHWPKVSTALLAGGGMPTGQVIGATDSHGAAATESPVHYQNIFSTFYHKMGIDPKTTKIPVSQVSIAGQNFVRTQSMPLLGKPELVPELL